MKKSCPLVTYPGQIIGFVNGRPVRAIAGGSEPTPEPADTPEPEPTPDQTKPQPPAAGGKWDGKLETLDPEVQKVIEKYKNEAANASAKSREKAREEAQQDILKKLNLVKGDEKPDPDELAKKLSGAEQKAKQSQIELAVFRTASSHQGDPNALLDSRSFLAKVSDLDPEASDFATKVDAAIKQAVKENPKLKAVQAAAASSVDHAGGTGERRTDKPKTLAEAVSGHYGT